MDSKESRPPVLCSNHSLFMRYLGFFNWGKDISLLVSQVQKHCEDKLDFKTFWLMTSSKTKVPIKLLSASEHLETAFQSDDIIMITWNRTLSSSRSQSANPRDLRSLCFQSHLLPLCTLVLVLQKDSLYEQCLKEVWYRMGSHIRRGEHLSFFQNDLNKELSEQEMDRGFLMCYDHFKCS